MAFIDAFLWGTGFSLGICVGLLTWLFLRTVSEKILGIADHWSSSVQLQRDSLALLRERNSLTVETNEFAERIALMLERVVDDPKKSDRGGSDPSFRIRPTHE